jgi:hypothetical protein
MRIANVLETVGADDECCLVDSSSLFPGAGKRTGEGRALLASSWNCEDRHSADGTKGGDMCVQSRRPRWGQFGSRRRLVGKACWMEIECGDTSRRDDEDDVSDSRLGVGTVHRRFFTW